MGQLVERKDELGLLEVSESASYGVHVVGRRVPGTTILENQVRISMLTRTEMDTNNKDSSRVVFHGPITHEKTPLLDDTLFTSSLTEEEAAAEYLRLKEREMNGQEDVPFEAKKSNKHYRPWECSLTELPDAEVDGEEDGKENAENTGFSIRRESLPIGLRESLVGVPQDNRLPVICGIMPLAATYADGVEVEYCDGNLQRLGLMAIIRGEAASNKSVVKNAVEIWMRQLEEEDALARKCEDKWKEETRRRAANEKAPSDPHVVVRTLPVTASCSTLLKRMKNAGGHTLYSFSEELDTLRKSNGGGGWANKYDLYRMAFDAGKWGQDYNSDSAESGEVNVRYNWTMLGTHGAVKKCFQKDNVENGLSSRILMAEMPDNSFAKMPKFGKRSAEDEEKIQQAVTILRSKSGLIDLPRLRRAIENWVEEKRVEAMKNIDHVKDVYRRRAAVIGFRCGVVFHLLTGREKETRGCTSFARMMAEYCLQQQIKCFGKAWESQTADTRECQRQTANHSIFDQLSQTFTTDDLATLKGNMPRNSISQILSRWRKDGWIEKVDKKMWRKTKK